MLDYLAMLEMDRKGLLNEDFTLKDYTGMVDAVDTALKDIYKREFQLLLHHLSRRISVPIEPKT